MNNGKWTLRIITVLGILAIILFVQLPKSPTSVPTEVIEVPADETVSNDQLISPEELKAAGDRLAAGAQDFGSDCDAAEEHTATTGGDARCLMDGLPVFFSREGLPPDPAELSAEQPIAP